jgi:hypothetical protein
MRKYSCGKYAYEETHENIRILCTHLAKSKRGIIFLKVG